MAYLFSLILKLTKFYFSLLCLILFNQSALASSFKHIKLHPHFENYLIKPKKNLLSTSETYKKIHYKMMTSFFPFSSKSKSKSKSQSKLIPLTERDESLPPLLDEIKTFLASSYQQIGQDEVDRLENINQQFNLGESNFSGFSWQKLFGSLKVNADRQVMPHFFDDDWLVLDTFTFEIEAASLLEQLKDAELVSMSEEEVSVFAGISFKRTFSYWHTQDSFKEGLRSDFQKLFLTFYQFNKNFIHKMNDKEIIKREDSWTTRAGAILSTPPLHQFSFKGGVLTKLSSKKSVILEKDQSNRHQKPFKYSFMFERNSSTQLSLELEWEFFKLLELSLFNFDLDFQSEKKFSTSLAFNNQDLLEIDKKPLYVNELKKLFRSHKNIQHLKPYVVELNQSSSKSREQEKLAFIWGKSIKQNTEMVKIINHNETKHFYRHYSQRLQVRKKILPHLFSQLMYQLFKIPLGRDDAKVLSKKMTLEYEDSHFDTSNPKIIRVSSNEKFSLSFSQYFKAQRTHRKTDKKTKKHLLHFTKKFTTLPTSILNGIHQNQIRGPIIVESEIKIEKEGFHHLLFSPDVKIFSAFVEACHASNDHLWLGSSGVRSKMLQQSPRRMNKADRCVQKLGKLFLTFKEDFFQSQDSPSLALFKTFATSLYKKINGLPPLEKLFGKENLFLFGTIQASTSAGFPYTTSFSSGQFRGLGVIDNFKRSSGLKAPISILNE